MTNAELKQAVHDKMQNEFKIYEAKLFLLPTREALQNSFEYISKQDIIYALNDADLTDSQCEALLNIPDPLDQIYDEYFDRETGYMEEFRDCIEKRAEYERTLQENDIFNKLNFELGLYNQINTIHPLDSEKSKVYGIALQTYEGGEPYGVLTVNLPHQMTDICEMIGIKNAAYIDTNNFPWATQLIYKGFAIDTGFTKKSGYCEYPLYQFNEEWLKSLKPIIPERNYDLYEKKYNEAKGIETEQDYEKKPEKLTVVCVEPDKPAYVKTIPSGLKSLQNEVGGYIEATYPWEDKVAIICNEEGKIIGLPSNRFLKDDGGEYYDVIAGNFLVVGLGEEDFCSLSPEQINTYLEMFKIPEKILFIGGEERVFSSNEIPVYIQSAEYARSHNEADAFRESYKLNIKCREAIQNALSDNYADNRLDTEKVWKQVTETYGKDRVVSLLAQTVKEKSYDGRISDENKKWATTIPTPNEIFTIEKPHIGLVDLLVAKARKETVNEKRSILEKLKSAKAKVEPSVPKPDRKKEQVI